MTSFRQSESGTVGILGGQTLSDPGMKIGEGGTSSVVIKLTLPAKKATENYLEELASKLEQESFDDTIEALNKAITDSSELSDLQDNVQVNMTSEGIRIQIVDREGGARFRQYGRARPRTI
jgi:chemotaxis protein MotB